MQLTHDRRLVARLLQKTCELDPGRPVGRPDQRTLVLDRELPITALEELLLGPAPGRLGVEQEAVVVEEDCGRRVHA
jgi:hypothetical protein